ncbi:endolytic transglycosylase MltG [Roseivirga sp. BDSF3-8]|uniref:endolytic transglycosylase MltG n=1 Tax=Roseivirga sp. BDSF3-8 TaxID=3241598 RepID=UPI0035327064
MFSRSNIIKLVLFLMVILVISFIFYGYQILTTPNIQVGKESTALVIPTGSDFEDVQKLIYKKKIVHDPVSFSFLARLLGYDEQVKPGLYVLKKDMTNLEAIRKLRAGEQTPVNVTFNLVRLKEELAEKITQNIEADKEDVLALLQDSAVAASYGFTPETFMSMFLPNTYEFWYTTDAEGVLERMHEEYKKFWTAERKQQAAEMNLTPAEVATLASIVQAESNVASEKPTIAGVYLNRLDRGIPLQADPTLVYAAGDFTIRRVLNKHKEIDSPYNTYKYAGLPPGPIQLPSISSINSVLNHEDHNYLYFCAKEDLSGEHAFASTLSEHLRNASRYQRALNKAKLYR